MNKILMGLLFVIVGVIIVLINFSTQYFTPQVYFIGLVVIAGLFTFGIMLLLSKKLEEMRRI